MTEDRRKHAPFTFRLPDHLRIKLDAEETRTGAKPGATIRIALEKYFAEPRERMTRGRK